MFINIKKLYLFKQHFLEVVHAIFKQFYFFLVFISHTTFAAVKSTHAMEGRPDHEGEVIDIFPGKVPHFLTIAQHLFKKIEGFVTHFPSIPVDFGMNGGFHNEHQVIEIFVVIGEFHVNFAHGDEPFHWVGYMLQGLHHAQQFGETFFMERMEDVVFIFKIEVDSARTVFNFFRNIADAGAVKTFFKEYFLGRFQNQAAHLQFFPLLAGGYCHFTS